MRPRDLPTSDLIAALRRAASIWFKNDDLLLLEELIRRIARADGRECPDVPPDPVSADAVHGEGEP